MKLLVKSLIVVLCVLLPDLICAAVEEPPVDQPPGVSITDKAKTSPKAPESRKKNLANEPVPLGQLLYENQCHACHESTVHVRDDHKAKTYEDIQYWVGRWAKELDTKWSADEIEAVVRYLNDTYYHY